MHVDDDVFRKDHRTKRFMNVEESHSFTTWKETNANFEHVFAKINFKIETDGIDSFLTTYSVISAAAFIGGFHRFLNFICSWFVWLCVKDYFGLKSVIAVKSDLIDQDEDFDENTKEKLEYIKTRQFHVKYHLS